MYCWKCGVKLAEGETVCPLCGTPLPLTASTGEARKTYSERYPSEASHAGFLLLGFLTAILFIGALSCLLVCLKLHQAVAWSGYVMLSCALAWIILILPRWFRRPSPTLFTAIDFAAAGAFLLYVCLKTGGHWFLSFAFPITGILCIITITCSVLLRRLRRGRLYVIAGLFFACGGLCMLIELFSHITFHTAMFLWSLYGVAFFSALGLFLLIAAIIPPLREYLERKFFI